MYVLCVNKDLTESIIARARVIVSPELKPVYGEQIMGKMSIRFN